MLLVPLCTNHQLRIQGISDIEMDKKKMEVGLPFS